MEIAPKCEVSRSALFERLKTYLPGKLDQKWPRHLSPSEEGAGIIVWNLIVNHLFAQSDMEVEPLKLELIRKVDSLIGEAPIGQDSDAGTAEKLRLIIRRVGQQYVTSEWKRTWLNQKDSPKLGDSDVELIHELCSMIASRLERDLLMGWTFLEGILVPIATKLILNRGFSYGLEMVTAMRIWTFVVRRMGRAAAQYGQAFVSFIISHLTLIYEIQMDKVHKERARALVHHKIFKSVLSAITDMVYSGYDDPDNPWLFRKLFGWIFNTAYNMPSIMPEEGELIYNGFLQLVLIMRFRGHCIEKDWKWMATRLTTNQLFTNDVSMNDDTYRHFLDLVENTARQNVVDRNFLPMVMAVGAMYVQKSPSVQLEVQLQLVRIIRKAGASEEKFRNSEPFMPMCNKCRKDPRYRRLIFRKGHANCFALNDPYVRRNWEMLSRLILKYMCDG